MHCTLWKMAAATPPRGSGPVTPSTGGTKRRLSSEPGAPISRLPELTAASPAKRARSEVVPAVVVYEVVPFAELRSLGSTASAEAAVQVRKTAACWRVTLVMQVRPAPVTDLLASLDQRRGGLGR